MALRRLRESPVEAKAPNRPANAPSTREITAASAICPPIRTIYWKLEYAKLVRMEKRLAKKKEK